MPAHAAGPVHRFARLMVVAALSHVVTSTFAALLAVYLDAHNVPAVAVSGFALCGSYLASVMLAGLGHRRFALPVSLFLMAFGSVGLSADTTMVFGGIAFIVGIGLFRPAMIAQITLLRPADMSRERAFSLYTAVINCGYIAGPFIAEILRFRVGWSWLFVVLSTISGISAVLSMLWIRSLIFGNSLRITEEGTERESVVIGALLLIVLAAVTLFYAISQITTSNLALLVEKETLPIPMLGGWALKAGSLASLHGALVLTGSLLLSLRKRPWNGAFLACVGLVLYAVAFALLAGLQYPTSQSWIVLTFAVLSAAESIVGPSMLALGSRLTSGRRGLYWLAAMAGYWGAGAIGVLWERWSHLHYFAAVALACLAVAALVVWRAGAQGWR